MAKYCLAESQTCERVSNLASCYQSLMLDSQEYYYGVIVLVTPLHKICWAGVLLAKNWGWARTLPLGLVNLWLNTLIGVSAKIKGSSYNETRVGL